MHQAMLRLGRIRGWTPSFANDLGRRGFITASREIYVRECRQTVNVWRESGAGASRDLVKKVVNTLASFNLPEEAHTALNLAQDRAGITIKKSSSYMRIMLAYQRQEKTLEIQQLIFEVLEKKLRLYMPFMRMMVFVNKSIEDTISLLEQYDYEIDGEIVVLLLDAAVQNKISTKPVMEEISKRKIKLPAKWYSVILQVARRRGDQENFSNVLQAALSDPQLKRDSRFYEDIIHVLSDMRDIEGAKAAISTMMNEGMKPTQKHLLQLAKGYSNVNDLASLREVHSLMEQSSVRWNFVSIFQMSRWYSLVGDSRGVEELYKILRERQIVPKPMYIAHLIWHFGKEGRLDEAKKIFEVARARNVDTPNFWYGAFLGALILNGKRAKAVQLFHRIPNKNGYIYNVLARAYAEEGNVEGVKYCLKMTQQEIGGMEENCQTSLIEAYGKSRQLEGSRKVYEEMRKRGKFTNMKMYEAMIEACGVNGEVDEAQEILDNMEKNGLQPHGSTLAALIDAYGINGYHEKALSVFDSIRDRGHFPNKTAYNSIIRALATSGKVSEALEILQHMIERELLPNGDTFNALIMPHVASGNLTAASEIFNTLLKVQPKPGRLAFEVLIRGFDRHSSLDDAIEAFKKMRLSGCQIDEELVDEIVQHKYNEKLARRNTQKQLDIKRGMADNAAALDS